MKITKSQFKKVIQEEIEGALADPQLTELFGFGGKKKKAAARAAQRAKEEEEYETEEAKFAAKRQGSADERRIAAKMKADKEAGRDVRGRSTGSASSAGAKAAAESDYEKCKKSTEANIQAGKYGTHGNPSEADEARNRCSERYKMAMKKIRESQKK